MEELEQKRDDYILTKTTPDDLSATGKIESTGVVRSAFCDEKNSTIITPEHATRTEKVRLAKQLSYTNPFLSYP